MLSRVKSDMASSKTVISRRDFLGSTVGGVAGLALASDGFGQPPPESDTTTWGNHKVMKRSGSCYTTIIEVEPNVVFMLVDQWYCRITLKQKHPIP